jgi:hypothetical protein
MMPKARPPPSCCRSSPTTSAAPRSAAYTEYQAILNWLGEFDVIEDFAERALEYRMRIGTNEFPEDGEAYLRALIGIAKDTAGA